MTCWLWFLLIRLHLSNMFVNISSPRRYSTALEFLSWLNLSLRRAIIYITQSHMHTYVKRDCLLESQFFFYFLFCADGKKEQKCNWILFITQSVCKAASHSYKINHRVPDFNQKVAAFHPLFLCLRALYGQFSGTGHNKENKGLLNYCPYPDTHHSACLIWGGFQSHEMTWLFVV